MVRETKDPGRNNIVKEDAIPVNNIGSGSIQGAGQGPRPESEPGVPRKKKLSVILANAKMLRRKIDGR